MQNFLSKKSLFCLKNFSFSTSIYAHRNIQSQKIFKFTKNADDAKELNDRNRFLQNQKKIKILKEKIKNEDFLSHTTKSKISDQKTYMLGGSAGGSTTYNEHFNNKRELIKELSNLVRENEKLKDGKSWAQNFDQKRLNFEKDEVIRYSMVKDVFSHKYHFTNKFLHPSFYALNVNDRMPRNLRKEEEEVNQKQENAETEIRSVIEEKIENELKGISIFDLQVPVKIANKPIIRSSPSKEPMNGLLLEKDMNVEYETNLEYERLLKLSSLNDDFGKKIKEEEEGGSNEKDTYNTGYQAEAPKSDLFNRGKPIDNTISDSIISNLVK